MATFGWCLQSLHEIYVEEILKDEKKPFEMIYQSITRRTKHEKNWLLIKFTGTLRLNPADKELNQPFYIALHRRKVGQKAFYQFFHEKLSLKRQSFLPSNNQGILSRFVLLWYNDFSLVEKWTWSNISRCDDTSRTSASFDLLMIQLLKKSHKVPIPLVLLLEFMKRW